MEKGHTIMVEKADGTRESYSEEKLRESLKRAGASGEHTDYVAMHIKKELTPGIQTSTIYKHAFEQLKRLNRATAARYTLRKALAELGPTGFPFERFVAGLLERDGFQTEVGAYISGACVEHEVDVIATKEDRIVVAEVKFHNQSKIKSDLKVALYVDSRFKDLAKNNFSGYLSEKSIPECWLITNTKFTSPAIKYAECRGITLIGWNYPKEGNLEQRIEKASLQPITVLTSINNKQKKELIKNGVVLCRSVRDKKDVLAQGGLNKDEIEAVVQEAEGACHL